jgi:predicted ATP-dependent endonuclease of OLD family
MLSDLLINFKLFIILNTKAISKSNLWRKQLKETMKIEANYDLLFNKDNSDLINNVVKSYFLEDESEPMTYLPNTNFINIIIGTNNSGKSRFMRYLMQGKSFIGVRDLKRLNNSVEEYNSSVKRFNKEKIQDPYEKHATIKYYSTSGVDEAKERLDFLFTNKLVELDLSNLSSYANLNERFQDNVNRLLKLKEKGVTDLYFENFTDIDSFTVKDFLSPECIYIPTLRSAHSLFQKDGEDYSKIENDIYLDTLNRYYSFEDENVQVFTGLHLYKEILNSRNSKRSVRQSFEKFEKFISENFFGNKQIDIVAEFNKDDSLSGKNHSEIISVHIEGEKETRKLFELGDGIQAIIILMYKIFMANNNSFIFIDEPEINLHPGMQRLMLNQISSNKYLKDKNLTYFISTHSNHFLDLTLEKKHISIYSFISNSEESGERKFSVRNVNAGDNSILKNLGVNNSSVFLANCSIWVEGVSDRNYIKAFLNSYLNSLNQNRFYLKEDIDYAFFEYAGSNINHYFFDDISDHDYEKLVLDINALALNNRIFLLADSDIAKRTSKKGIRLKKLEDLQQENFQPYVMWNVREIENLLTRDIWGKLLISICNKDLLVENQEIIEKNIISVLNEIDLEKYSKDYIGVFLNEVSTKLGKIKKKNILNESSYAKAGETFGTLTNKRGLSEFLLEQEIDWEIFKQNDEIKKLTENIYKFIISNKT